MKLFFICNILSSLYLLHFLWTSASSQYFDDPTLNFKPFEFDSILRGQYNVTFCVTELINCWEMMRPDVMCDASWEWFDYETFCGISKKYCSDTYGNMDGYNNRFIAFTGYCRPGQDWAAKGQYT